VKVGDFQKWFNTCSLTTGEAFYYLDGPMERVTGADVPMPYAQCLEVAALPQVENVINTVSHMLNRKL